MARIPRQLARLGASPDLETRELFDDYVGPYGEVLVDDDGDLVPQDGVAPRGYGGILERAKAYADGKVGSSAVTTRAAMQGLVPSAGDVAFLTEEGREGQFVFRTIDLSAKVTSDPEQGVYVAPASDATGASGAWVRKWAGRNLLNSWFGAGVAGLNASMVLALALGVNVTLTEIVNATSSALFHPGVKVNCKDTGGVKQVGSFARLLDFETNAAHGAHFVRGTIDQDSDTNGLNYPSYAAYVYDTNDVVLRSNKFIDLTGFGVFVRDGLRPVVRENLFSGGYYQFIYVDTAGIQRPTRGEFTDNTFERIGIHAISLMKTDNNIIRRNRCYGNSMRGTVVNFVGATVNWVSGPNFSTLRPGNFLIWSGGTEGFIQSIESDTSLTLSVAVGSYAGIAASGGCGDHIGITTGNDNVVEGNYIYDGASVGITCTKVTSGPSEGGCSRNSICDNVIMLQGSCAIAVLDTGPGSYTNDHAKITGNHITACAQNGTTADANFNCGIVVTGSTTQFTMVSGNNISDYSGKMLWGVALGADVNYALVGSNPSTGMVNSGIRNGLGTITLSAGWGAGATASVVAHHGTHAIIVVNSGTSPSGNPTITVPLRAIGLSYPVQPGISMISSGFTGLETKLQSNTNTSATFIVTGPANASTAYTFRIVF